MTTKIDKLVQELKNVILPGSKVIIGDFNFEFTDTNVLTSFLKRNSLTQIVNRPTHTEGGRIDHCYLSHDLKNNYSADYQFRYYSDHLAICLSFHDKCS